jgi:hypothetical protein
MNVNPLSRTYSNLLKVGPYHVFLGAMHQSGLQESKEILTADGSTRTTAIVLPVWLVNRERFKINKYNTKPDIL